jgi:hypothetical protein
MSLWIGEDGSVFDPRLACDISSDGVVIRRRKLPAWGYLSAALVGLSTAGSGWVWARAIGTLHDQHYATIVGVAFFVNGALGCWINYRARQLHSMVRLLAIRLRLKGEQV